MAIMIYLEADKASTSCTEIGYGALVIQVERFFPSSQLCRKCQVKNQDLTLGDGIFRCVSPTCQQQENRLSMNDAQRQEDKAAKSERRDRTKRAELV